MSAVELKDKGQKTQARDQNEARLSVEEKKGKSGASQVIGPCSNGSSVVRRRYPAYGNRSKGSSIGIGE